MPYIFSRPSFAQPVAQVAPAGFQQFGTPPLDLNAGAAQAGQIVPLPITPPTPGVGGIIGGGGIDVRDGDGEDGVGTILGPQRVTGTGQSSDSALPNLPPFPFTQKELMHIMSFRKGGY